MNNTDEKNVLYYQEQLDVIKNEMTHLWGSAFITGGGSFALLYNEHNFANIFWGCVGIFITIVFFNTYIMRRNEVTRILKFLKEQK